jgi:plastocyanin
VVCIHERETLLATMRIPFWELPDRISAKEPDMHDSVRLIRRCGLPLFLLFTLIISTYTPSLRANDTAPSLTLTQDLLAQDDASTPPAVISALLPGVRSIIMTTVSNTTNAAVFVRVAWREAHYGPVLAHDGDYSDSAIVRLAAGETRRFRQPVPPPPALPLIYSATIRELALTSVVEACILPNQNAAEQPCPDPATRTDSVINRLVVPLRLGDLGDAPDSTNHAGVPMRAYPGVEANFPTVYDPTTGTPSGPLHADPRPFHLGQRVSLEVEADLGPDQDGITNIVPSADQPDNDRADDGIRIDLSSLQHCEPARLAAQVFIAPAFQASAVAAGVTRGYLNIWIDGNRDGDWADRVECPSTASKPFAVEHILIDAPIDLASLSAGMNRLTFTTDAVPWPIELANRPAWMRATLSLEPSSKPLSAGDLRYGDGRGLEDAQGNAQRFRYGETEDYLINRSGATAQPDLAVRKTGRLITDTATGDRIAAWIVEYRNIGAAPATDVVLTEQLTDQAIGDLLIGVRSDPPIEPTVNPNTLSFALGTLEPGVSGQILLRTRLPAGGSLTNTATISARNDANPDNNSASATLAAGVRAPVIVSPGAGITCNTSLTFRGLADPGAQVRLANEAGTISETTTADQNGRWTITLTLNEGRNWLYAQAQLNGQTSPRSARVAILVNPNLPFDPLSMTITDLATGVAITPDNPNGITGLTGWFAHLRPNTQYQFSVRACCTEGTPTLTLFVGSPTAIPLSATSTPGVYSAEFNSGALSGLLRIRLSGACGDRNAQAEGNGMRVDLPQVVDARTGAPISGAEITIARPTNDSNGETLLLERLSSPLRTDSNGLFDFDSHLRALQIQVRAEGYQPVTLRTDQLGNFEIQDLRSPAPTLAGSLPDHTRVMTHWQGPLTATFRLLLLFGNELRYVKFLSSGGFNGSSISIKPGSVIDFVNTDLRAREIRAPRTPEMPDPMDRNATIMHHDGVHSTTTAPPFTSGQIAPGEVVSIAFDTPGVYTITDVNDGHTALVVIVSEASPPPEPAFRIFLPLLRR